MTRRSTAQTRSARESRQRQKRTQAVWMLFLLATATASGALLLTDESMRTVRGALMLGSGTILEGGADTSLIESLSHREPARWQAIVIHHSGSPAGDAEMLNRLHIEHGLDGLGYHFVIGNGSGMGDGAIHVGYRWSRQLPGAHALGDDADWFNRNAIAICLIGNGESRPFTERQMQSLDRLIAELERRFSIVPSKVVLHREIAPVRSPGRFFDETAFRARLGGGRR